MLSGVLTLSEEKNTLSELRELVDTLNQIVALKNRTISELEGQREANERTIKAQEETITVLKDSIDKLKKLREMDAEIIQNIKEVLECESNISEQLRGRVDEYKTLFDDEIEEPEEFEKRREEIDKRHPIGVI